MCSLFFSSPATMIRAAWSGWVIRTLPSSPSGIATPEFSVISVATAPGMITETRTGGVDQLGVQALGEELTAALLAPYIVWPGNGKKPPMLDTFARCASGRSTSSGRNARDMCTVPIRFTSSTRRIAASSSSATGQERLDHAGVVEQPVDGPVRRDHGSRQRLDRGLVGDVDDVRRQPVAGPGHRAVSPSPPALTSTAATRAPLAAASGASAPCPSRRPHR